MDLTVIVPTFNEAPNVPELVSRLAVACKHLDCEVVFVDDSTDETPLVIESLAAGAGLPVRLIRRDRPDGGLGGAVLEGMGAARSDVCLVMDGDLQHPPEDAPRLYERFLRGDADLVVASRYIDDGAAGGLAGRMRVGVSRAAALVTRAMFPIRLRACSDPMTGFFLVDRRRLDLATLRPSGFKILFEVLARHQLRVAEVPFRFAERRAGDSKASLRQGARFLAQLTALRFGRMSGFALVGALGAVVNVLIVAALVALDVGYVIAAIIAAEVTIVGNFLLNERFVFGDMRSGAAAGWVRFAKSFAFNNAEAAVRIPVMALMVERLGVSSVVATAVTLAVAFVVRFTFHSLVVYAPRPAVSERTSGGER